MRAVPFALFLFVAAAPVNADQSAGRAEVWLHRPLEALISKPETELAPFTTDGCSGGMSAIWERVAEFVPEFAHRSGQLPPWENCCVTHDRAYHNAGGAKTAEDSASARVAADEALRSCVASVSGPEAEQMISGYDMTEEEADLAFKVIGDAMYRAVRLGGVPCSGLPWRWGYGYPECQWLGD